MIDYEAVGRTIAVVTGSVVGAAFVVRALARRLSRDWLETHSDRAEVQAIKTWREEAERHRIDAERQRSRADQAFDQLREQAEQSGILRERVSQLTADVDRLEKEVITLRQRLELLLSGARGTNPGR